MRRSHDHSVWSTQDQSTLGAELLEGGPGPGDAYTSPAAHARVTAPNPSSAELFTVGEGQDGAGDEEDTQCCPDSLRSMDSLLTGANGKPSLFCRFCQLCCLAQAPHILFGTLFSPGISEAVQQEDKLMGLVLLCFAAMLAGTSFILEDLRRAVRPGGPLQQLGAGTRRIPASLVAAIDGAVKKFHPDHRPFKIKLGIVALLLLVVVVHPEIYVHSAWHNRASAALIFLFWSFGNTFIAVWIISMRTAT